MNQTLNLLTAMPLGLTFVCPERGYSSAQVLVGHSNVFSERLDYPQMLLVYDAFGSCECPDIQYLSGLRAITVSEWASTADYINKRNPLGNSGNVPTAGSIHKLDLDSFKAYYINNHSNVLNFIEKRQCPFPGGNVEPNALFHMLGLQDKVTDFFTSYPNSKDTPREYTESLHRVLQTEWATLIKRMSLVISDVEIADMKSSRLAIGYCYSQALKPIMDSLGFLDFSEQECMDMMSIAECELFSTDSLLWVHHTSGQNYRMLGMVDNYAKREDPIIVYANVNNNNVYTRKASDWLRSMSIANPDDII